MDTCVPLATKNQVRQPKKRVPGAYRGAGNDLDLSKSVMVGQELVDGLHRARLECAFCPPAREDDSNLLDTRERILAWRGHRRGSPRGPRREPNRLQVSPEQNPVDQR